MTPPNAQNGVPIELLRAELKAAMADQMLILIDRFAARRDLDEVKGMIIAQRTTTDTKLDTFFERMQQSAVTDERARQIADEALDERLKRAWVVKSGRASVGLLVMAVVSFLGSPLVAYFVAHHHG